MGQYYGYNNVDDNLLGSSGNDDIRGFSGNDFLDGNGGNDTMRGGSGNDTYIFDGGDQLLETLNEGTDTVLASVSYTLVAHIENLTLTGSANIHATGNGLANVIAGNAGNNVLNGGVGIDTLQMTRAAGSNVLTTANLSTGTATGHGTDTLQNFENVRGTSGGDHITGSAGNNLLQGLEGSDTFFVTAGTDSIDGGLGNDLISFAGTAAATLNLASGSYSAGSGTQGSVTGVEHATGGAQGDTLTGDAAANQLSGAGGADTLKGGGGADILQGGLGSDRLIADAGDDVLTGNQDAVDVTADIFEVQTTAGHVTVTDFQPGVDKIDLSSFGFNAAGVSTNWTASACANTHDTELLLSGPGGAQVSITLQGLAQGGAASLSLGDFIGGSPALIPAPAASVVPGGNGVADVFVIDPQHIIQNLGGVLDLPFENGLDVVDLSALQLNSGTYWGGWFYDYGPNDQTRLEFWGQNNEFFAVNLMGHSYFQADASDFLL